MLGSMQAAAHQLEDLTDAVYRAAFDPSAWPEVMQGTAQHFPSLAQTFYLLHMQPHRVQPVSLAGVDNAWVRRFDALYFTPDNPWLRVSRQLHQPGIVRTNNSLDRLLRRRGALYGSTYFNEWMRPQGFKHTIGNTLLNEGGIVANITLLRAGDRPGFSAAEVRDFAALSRHMTRALQMSIRLERGGGGTGTAVLDALPQPLAIVGARGRLLHANAAMEALLRRGRGLALLQGELRALHPGAQAALAERVSCALATGAGLAAKTAALRLAVGGHAHIDLTLLPLRGPQGRTLIAGPTALVVAAESDAPTVPSLEELCRRHALTPAEGRLALCLLQGLDLRAAAQASGITYGTARVYLKTVFEKAGVHTQAQLVARLLHAQASASPPV
jgi:DNA-binding CsgD family transcriptional regulator/PAS domain-containing protein